MAAGCACACASRPRSGGREGVAARREAPSAGNELRDVIGERGRCEYQRSLLAAGRALDLPFRAKSRHASSRDAVTMRHGQLPIRADDAPHGSRSSKSCASWRPGSRWWCSPSPRRPGEVRATHHHGRPRARASSDRRPVRAAMRHRRRPGPHPITPTVGGDFSAQLPTNFQIVRDTLAESIDAGLGMLSEARHCAPPARTPPTAKLLLCLVSLENQSLGGMMADREGFEPPIPLQVCRISSAVHSTTLPPVRGRLRSKRGGYYTSHRQGASLSARRNPLFPAAFA